MAGVIYLIRHLPPATQGVLLGQSDPPLAARGEHAPLALDAATIFCSPLLRARQTAEIFFPGRAVIHLPELAEHSLGEWDGLTWQEIEAEWPEIARAKLAGWQAVTPPGGEPWSAFEARVARAWQRIAAAPRPCAVVAHAGVNSVLAKLATGLDPLGFNQQYGEVTSLAIL